MVPWWGLVMSMIAGACIAFVILAMVALDDHKNDKEEWK